MCDAFALARLFLTPLTWYEHIEHRKAASLLPCAERETNDFRPKLTPCALSGFKFGFDTTRKEVSRRRKKHTQGEPFFCDASQFCFALFSGVAFWLWELKSIMPRRVDEGGKSDLSHCDLSARQWGVDFFHIMLRKKKNQKLRTKFFSLKAESKALKINGSFVSCSLSRSAESDHPLRFFSQPDEDETIYTIKPFNYWKMNVLLSSHVLSHPLSQERLPTHFPSKDLFLPPSISAPRALSLPPKKKSSTSENRCVHLV